MSFLNLSVPVVLAGLAALAGLLFLLQRLRVRHREIEVVTTLFWHEAVEDAQVRIFWSRFRHLLAYLLVLAIAALVWLALAEPAATSLGESRHVVLLDATAGMERPGRYEAAIDTTVAMAASLPRDERWVYACAPEPRLVLRPGERLMMLRERLGGIEPAAAPPGIESAVRGLASAAPEQVLIVGDGPVRRPALDALPGTTVVRRVAIEGDDAANAGITALGVSGATSGAWNRVDVLVEVYGASDASLTATLDGAPVEAQFEWLDGAAERRIGRWSELPAAGATLAVRLADGGAIAADDEATLVLPDRPLVRVALESDVPEPLRAALEADPAVVVVADEPDVVITTDPAGDRPALVLVGDEAPDAITVVHEPDRDPARVLASAMADLALDEVDAMELARATDRPIVVTARPVDDAAAPRAIHLWSALLDDRYDFVQSRTFPIFVARAVRWLAGQPPLRDVAAAGEPLVAGLGPWTDDAGRSLDPCGAPMVLPVAGRYTDERGAAVAVSLLDRVTTGGVGPADALTAEPVEASVAPGFDAVTLILLVVLVLLAVEWHLYRNGRMP